MSNKTITFLGKVTETKLSKPGLLPSEHIPDGRSYRFGRGSDFWLKTDDHWTRVILGQDIVLNGPFCINYNSIQHQSSNYDGIVSEHVHKAMNMAGLIFCLIVWALAAWWHANYGSPDNALGIESSAVVGFIFGMLSWGFVEALQVMVPQWVSNMSDDTKKKWVTSKVTLKLA